MIRKLVESASSSAAAAAAASPKEEVALRILVDEKKNIVVYAEAGKDFVDVLLSFLTLPLGTIARIVSNGSNMKKVSVGSLSSLYQSVANLDVNQFWTDTCKELLLHPRNSSEDYCQNLKLNIDDTEKTKYFICENWECSRKSSGGLLSIFRNKRCNCGKLMNREILRKNKLLINSEGFVHDGYFIIFDDLKVTLDNVHSSVSQPKDFGIKDYNAIKVVTVNVTRKEIVELFQISLLSNTPLTDFFLRRELFYKNVNQRSNTIVLNNVKIESIDGVEFMLGGNSCLGSIDNLYKSILVLDPLKDFKSPNLKDKLVKSRIAQHFKLQNQILPIDEDPIVKYSCYTNCIDGFSEGYLTTAQFYINYERWKISNPLTYVEPQSSISGSGFVKKPSLFMVTDDLVVTPGSSITVVSFLAKTGFFSSDLDEEVICIGKKECLRILKASLISSSALTDGLGQFIFPIKKE
ncbi:unnamed protein product [Lupinus luteus]|uniref:DUF674 family protein n=1 Tax=Lupinus luteus TaxID=3873 RepID=A0AAV1XYI7_LUPLU